MLANMLGFMKKTQRIRNNELEGSIYLSQLDADELDPEIARLYLPHCHCMDTFKPEGKQNLKNYIRNYLSSFHFMYTYS